MPSRACSVTCCRIWLFPCSLFSQSGQSAGQAFGQQGVYNNMSITVSMAGGSGSVGSLPPMGQPVGISNSNLSSVGSVCSDQQVSDFEEVFCLSWLLCRCIRLLILLPPDLNQEYHTIMLLLLLVCFQSDIRGKKNM